jgi:hypothetical protein
MKTWSFYDAATGIFSGRRFRCAHADRLAENTPPGHRALEGAFDADTVRVNLETGAVEAFRPKRPSDLHRWDGQQWALPASARRQQLRDQLAALDQRSARPVAELAADPQNSEALRVLQSILLEKQSLREQLSQLKDAP